MQLVSDTLIKDDLGGAMSVKLKANSNLDEYCRAHVAGYDPARFEILAVRVYIGKETYITLFAVDKSHKERPNWDISKIPVKKFKSGPVFLRDLFPLIEECNFTLTTGRHHLAEMEVINK